MTIHKYLITGGARFIGSNLYEELLSKGNQVVYLDNFSTDRIENLLPLRDCKVLYKVK